MLFYSDVITKRDQNVSLGEQHYSYSVPAQRISSMFNKPIHINRPEIYNSRNLNMAYKMIRDEKLFHLSFRSFHNIRFLKGAFNVAHIPWEFLTVKIRKKEGDLWNQVSLLNKLDEVWTTCSFSKNVLSEFLEIPIYKIPTPIKLGRSNFDDNRKMVFSRLYNLQSVPLRIIFGSDNRFDYANSIKPLKYYINNIDNRKVYISVLNPGDWRKNVEKILRGFAAFSDSNKDSILIIKLVIDNKNARLDNVQQDTILPKFLDKSSLLSKNVIFIAEQLSDDVISDFYSMADFYITLSVGEGQNLPLLEAMAHGCIPVSVDHTAMADYITEENSIVIRSVQKEVYNPELSEYSDCGWFKIFDVSMDDYITALERSYTLSSNELYQKRFLSRKIIDEKYSYYSVRSLIAGCSLLSGELK